MKYGCIGEHLPHSFSKEIHEKIGDYAYELIELTPEQVGPFMIRREFDAINVTIPYKQTVIPYLDGVDETASAIGAVNTVVNRNGKLFGYNTDAFGMQALIEKENVLLKGKKVLILGTGGTSKTAGYVAFRLGASEIRKVSRKEQPGAITYKEALEKYKDANIFINTTPVGMYPDLFHTAIDVTAFPELDAVIDAVYNPLRTMLTVSAIRAGIKAQTGLYMLVSQAVRAYEIFMDTVAEEGTADRIFKEIYNSKQNIVLTGMPGSGKTTIGTLLAEKLGRPFIDTDDLIVKKAGCAISDIFRLQGEAEFRRMETETVKEISSKSGCVIATGGGAVLNTENMDALKMNGRVYFLDRSPELLAPTSDRPLALSKEAIFNRYRERYDIYCRTADEIVDDNSAVAHAAQEIERRHFK